MGSELLTLEDRKGSLHCLSPVSFFYSWLHGMFIAYTIGRNGLGHYYIMLQPYRDLLPFTVSL